jgi:hypothetical protein
MGRGARSSHLRHSCRKCVQPVIGYFYSGPFRGLRKFTALLHKRFGRSDMCSSWRVPNCGTMQTKARWERGPEPHVDDHRAAGARALHARSLWLSFGPRPSLGLSWGPRPPRFAFGAPAVRLWGPGPPQGSSFGAAAPKGH